MRRRKKCIREDEDASYVIGLANHHTEARADVE
jgi:hypothetical protein